jgi:hypothetical protein
MLTLVATFSAAASAGAPAGDVTVNDADPHCRNDQYASACTAAAGRACKPASGHTAGSAQAFATAAELVSAPILLQQQQLQQQHQAGSDGQEGSSGPDPEDHAVPCIQHANVDAASGAAVLAAPASERAADAGHVPGDELPAGAVAAASLRTRASASGGLFATAKGKVIQISDAQRRKGEALLAQMEAAGAAEPPSAPQQPQKPSTFRAPKPFNRPRPQPVWVLHMPVARCYCASAYSCPLNSLCCLQQCLI